VTKPVPVVEATPEQLGQVAAEALPPHTMLLVPNGRNIGYAAGNNSALRWFARQPTITHAWVLNNDTVVTPSALPAMLRRLRARPDAGLCGCRLRYYHAPDSVQALGGLRYNRWLGSATAITKATTAGDGDIEVAVEKAMDMVHGASVLISGEFLRHVGPLAEDYFLYSEEIDWAERGRRTGFGLAYAHDATVYHKEGAVVGTSSDPYRRSWISDFYAVRSRLRVAVKFYPATLPGVYLGLAAVILNRLRRRQFDRALMVLKLALSPASYRPHRGDAPPHLDDRWR
jgi:GT2 family glycosyltransferase